MSKLEDALRRADDLERELRNALAITAAIIMRYGAERSDGSFVAIVRDTDLERIERDPPTVYREDTPEPGVAFTLTVRP